MCAVRVRARLAGARLAFGLRLAGLEPHETGDPRRRNALDPGFHGVPQGGVYGMMWEKGGVWGLGVI